MEFLPKRVDHHANGRVEVLLDVRRSYTPYGHRRGAAGSLLNIIDDQVGRSILQRLQIGIESLSQI